MALSKITADSIAADAVSATMIADGSITNAKLGSDIDASKLVAGTLPIDRIANAAVTAAKLASTIDLTGKTVIIPAIQGGMAINTTLSGLVPNGLEFVRVGRRYTYAAGMNGSTWLNSGITFGKSYDFAYVLVDVIGNENGRNCAYRRYMITYNVYTGWQSGLISAYTDPSGNDYGQCVVVYQNNRLEFKAVNGVSSGQVRIFATEYIY